MLNDADATVLFDLDGVAVARVCRDTDGIRVVQVITADQAARVCPGCGARATRDRSHQRRVYALAGAPGASDSPNSYPYAHQGSLFDVTSGSTGSCSASVQCNAGTGGDGPTGLGTPNGTAAFAA